MSRFSVPALLDAAKAALDCATDSELAETLGVGASRICNYRKGRTIPNLWMARRLAYTLKMPPAKLILALRREKEMRRRRTGVR